MHSPDRSPSPHHPQPNPVRLLLPALLPLDMPDAGGGASSSLHPTPLRFPPYLESRTDAPATGRIRPPPQRRVGRATTGADRRIAASALARSRKVGEFRSRGLPLASPSSSLPVASPSPSSTMEASSSSSPMASTKAGYLSPTPAAVHRSPAMSFRSSVAPPPEPRDVAGGELAGEGEGAADPTGVLFAGSPTPVPGLRRRPPLPPRGPIGPPPPLLLPAYRRFTEGRSLLPRSSSSSPQQARQQPRSLLGSQIPRSQPTHPPTASASGSAMFIPPFQSSPSWSERTPPPPAPAPTSSSIHRPPPSLRCRVPSLRLAGRVGEDEEDSDGSSDGGCLVLHPHPHQGPSSLTSLRSPSSVATIHPGSSKWEEDDEDNDEDGYEDDDEIGGGEGGDNGFAAMQWLREVEGEGVAEKAANTLLLLGTACRGDPRS